MMVSVITGQSHESGAGTRLAVTAGFTKAFSMPMNPSPTVRFCSLTPSFGCSTSTSFPPRVSEDNTVGVCCEFPKIEKREVRKNEDLLYHIRATGPSLA